MANFLTNEKWFILIKIALFIIFYNDYIRKYDLKDKNQKKKNKVRRFATLTQNPYNTHNISHEYNP